MSGTIGIGLVFWLLMTGDFTADNVLIGLIGALIFSPIQVYPFPFKRCLHAVIRVVALIPKSYGQAIQMMVSPGLDERIASDSRSKGEDSWKVFERVFLITLTPRSTAITADKTGRIQVHYLEKQGRHCYQLKRWVQRFCCQRKGKK